MNTRDKRASAIGVGLAFLVSLPLPDGALDQGDRQQSVALYRGILATSPVVDVATECDTFLVPSDPPSMLVPADPMMAVPSDDPVFVIGGCG